MESGIEFKSPNESALPPQNCCIHLRCKSMYYRPDERPGLLHFSDTQNYWCSQTLERSGPDGESATPPMCGSSRGCFQAEE
jgi:hypothetical protein